MLYQTDLLLSPFDDSGMQSDLAVKIHGAAMREIPPALAGAMHGDGYHPFSVYALRQDAGWLVRVSALTDEAAQIPEALACCPSLEIYYGETPTRLSVLMQNTRTPADVRQLESRISAEGCRLIFETPAMIKIQSRPCAKPDICSYFYSVLLKYNEFEHKNLSYAQFQEAFRATRFGDYALRSASVQITGRTFPGMTGFCDLYFPRDTAQNTMLRKMLAYAAYSGVGSKTAQGMGGISLQTL